MSERTVDEYLGRVRDSTITSATCRLVHATCSLQQQKQLGIHRSDSRAAGSLSVTVHEGKPVPCRRYGVEPQARFNNKLSI